MTVQYLPCGFDVLTLFHTNVACSGCGSILFAAVWLQSIEQVKDGESISKCGRYLLRYPGTCLAGPKLPTAYPVKTDFDEMSPFMGTRSVSHMPCK